MDVSFSAPEGWLAYSRLIDEAQGRLFVCAFWYCDDDEALTRHSHDPSAPEFMESDIDVVKLLAALEHQLAIVLAWDRSDLKRVSRISAGRPKDERGNPTSELEKRFRLPVIDG